MFWSSDVRASENFYRNVFALAAFAAFACAFILDSPMLYCAVLMFGALSRTAVRKNWKNPAFAERTPWLVSAPKAGKD
ncbi:hypothetical protein FACS1894216_06810 [Synergistales bacterium]|nr:hypothetical protein FACS1894216_06810 [Synergistales bacterium]